MVMDTFEIRCMLSRYGTLFYWRLIAGGGGKRTVVATGQALPSKRDIEAEVHGLRRRAGRASVEDLTDGLSSVECVRRTFRVLPGVASLRVSASNPRTRSQRHQDERRPGKQRHYVMAADEAIEPATS
jgi:hypothetical protein